MNPPVAARTFPGTSGRTGRQLSDGGRGLVVDVGTDGVPAILPWDASPAKRGTDHTRSQRGA